MRNYRKQTDVLTELRELVIAKRMEGISRLDGERGLAAQFSAGRPTIAKALLHLEREGLIHRSRGGATILPFRQKYRYAYVARVHRINDTFYFPAYKDLWMELQKMAAEAGIRIEFLPYDPDHPETRQEFLEKLKAFDLVFFSLFFSLDFPPDVLQNRECRAILLNEVDECRGFPLYALDNFETGAMAARILLERGYRHPALIAPGINTASLDFLRRINGFASVMQQTGCEFELFSSYMKVGIEEMNLMQRCIGGLPRSGFDSAFFLDDRWVMLSDPLIEAGMVPEFGILAFDGTMTARCHNPPIDTLSHATFSLARKIREIIFLEESGHFRYDPSIRFRLAPDYYAGKTLRTRPNP